MMYEKSEISHYDAAAHLVGSGFCTERNDDGIMA